VSNCEVCIGGYNYDGYPEFYTWKYPKARKEYKCCECDRAILKGQQYERYTDKFDGSIHTAKTCMDCSHIRSGLTCEGNSSPDFGYLWYEIKGNFHQLKSTACLTKIPTASAKAYFLECWRQWKGLNP
jgi:hypothetical protein